MPYQHLCDQRWREVFLMLTGLRKADNLLLAIEKKIHLLIDTSKLQNLLIWVERITDKTDRYFQPLEKRAIALANAIANANVNSYAEAITVSYTDAKASAKASYYVEAFNKANFLAVAHSQDRDIVFSNPIANAKVNTNAYAYAFTLAIFDLINYIQWSEKFQIYQSINYSQLATHLEKFNQEISKTQESKQTQGTWAQQIIATWLKASHLTPEILDFSESEIEALDNYLYANLLIFECKKAAVRVSQETWSGIESRMLLPINNLSSKVSGMRIPGIDQGRFVVPDNFDDPLPADLLKSFESEP